ncbi:phosphatidylglycerophosphate synthase [Allocatelliglobosispora scoriae]|uniref:Phosphatidylglycerophosphate synthase n=1 Tax=Allocatelliglobosispora scoriae TaxID=643052 RepID=A0A841BV46_9ACTN|nr:CDP-alcohol phosphatidyltransferase family protein [Allocatelliglobosispora scoriae]MBB5870621.1 phosphatidylglycerophosphate synthase [Allocatelliglobosispora scoriae]
MRRTPLAEVQARTYKERDSWWTVLLVDPLAGRLTRLFEPYRWVTPNRITIVAFLFGLGAAAAFAFGGARESYPLMIAGAIAYHFSFVMDCIDGKIARLNGTGSVFGAWLDYIFDRLRIVVCTIALMGGQYAATKDITFLILGGVVVFLDMFRYLNSLEIFQVNTELRNRLDEARASAGLVSSAEQGSNPDEVAKRAGNRSMLALAGDSAGLGLFQKVRAVLRRSRIRPHLVGGIEFQMAVFIIAPLLGAWTIVPVTIVSGALMVLFELAVIYMLYRATMNVTRQIEAIKVPAQRAGEHAADLAAVPQS